MTAVRVPFPKIEPSHPMKTKPIAHFIEPLESRIAPAAVFTYTDVDGDLVTVKTSKGTNAGLAARLTLADSGLGKQLQKIDIGDSIFAGTNITITAKPQDVTGDGVKDGDGLVNVGYIDASASGGGTARNVGVITIRGDLGRIDAGDYDLHAPAVKGINVQSMGQFGTSTQQAGGSLESNLNGSLGSLKVAGNVKDVFLDVTPTIGPVTIGGSLIGGGGDFAGTILCTSTMGAVKIGGNIEGGDGFNSGLIDASKLTGITLGGSLFGGAGTQSGVISSNDAMGSVKIGGNIEGGSGLSSGRVRSSGTLAGITLGGSLIGGSGDDSGAIFSFGAMGAVKIGGNIEGGDGIDDTTLADTGLIEARRIASLTVGGSIIAGMESGRGPLIDSGAVRATFDIGPIVVKGSIIGNITQPVVITASGQVKQGATTDVAIKSLTVGGRVEFAEILAGYSTAGMPVGLNADAQIGPVVVGDWIASSLVAGTQDDVDALHDRFFGDGDDSKIFGGTDTAGVISKIASILIKGTALGTVGGVDHFGFVAQQIGSFKVGTTTVALTTGTNNDIHEIGATADVTIREVAL